MANAIGSRYRLVEYTDDSGKTVRKTTGIKSYAEAIRQFGGGVALR